MLINAKLNGIGSQGISMNKSTAKGTLSDSKIQTNRSVSPQVHKNVERDNSQVCLLFYQAKYMYNMIAVHESLLVINNIIQYNLF